MANDKKTKKDAPSGLNTAGMVLGIISIILAVIFIGAPLALLLSIIGLILAIVYKAKGGSKASGLVLSIISTILSIIMTFLFVVVMGTVVSVLVKGVTGDWSCTASNGSRTAITISTDGYKIDGSALKDLNDLSIEDLNVNVTNNDKEITAKFRSGDTVYTCEKH